MRPILKNGYFNYPNNKNHFQVFIFPGDPNKTIREFVHRCRLLKTEDDCEAGLVIDSADNSYLQWISNSLKEEIIFGTVTSDGTNLKVYYTLSSDEVHLNFVEYNSL